MLSDSKKKNNSLEKNRGLKTFMKKNPITSFFIIAYFISWIFWIPAVLYIKFALPTSEVPGWLMIPNLLGTWGPFVAALIMARIVKGKGGIKKILSSMLVWRVGLLWYLIIMLLVPIILSTAVGIYVLQGGVVGIFDVNKWYMLFIAPIPALLFGPLGEELGWRGFALPNLQRKYSALLSSVILGALWALWHAPAYWAPAGTVISGQPVTLWAVLWYFFFLIGISIIHTWIYNQTKSSVLTAIIFHAMYTAGAFFELFPEITTDALNVALKWAIIPIWIFAVIIIAIYGPTHLSRKKEEEIKEEIEEE